MTFGAPKFINTPAGRPMYVANADDGAYFSVITTIEGVTNYIVNYGTVVGNGSGILSSNPLTNLHQDGVQDDRPIVNQSETVIYFSSNRVDSSNFGDIFRAERPNKQADFGQPAHVQELSSQALSNVSWVSPDDCQVLIDRSSHIYVAKRPL